uniref:Fatty-acid and retinol-binding protein 1 n=1 Tax=Elaeophora elaphi TaxID=1147741 RepID=A0A0R3RI97_9BILA
MACQQALMILMKPMAPTKIKSLQHELRTFYNSLNEEEKVQLKKFAKANAANFSLTNFEFLDGVKKEEGGLFGKLTGLRDIVNAKLDTMQPESRRFIENLLRRFLAAFSQNGLMNILEALKGFGKEVIDMFDGLSKPIQDDILKAFPIIGSYVTSDITRLILRKLAELDLISRTSTSPPTAYDENQNDSGKPSPKSHFVEPTNFDIEGDKIDLLSTSTHSSVDDEELLSVKKIVVNK